MNPSANSMVALSIMVLVVAFSAFWKKLDQDWTIDTLQGRVDKATHRLDALTAWPGVPYPYPFKHLILEKKAPVVIPIVVPVPKPVPVFIPVGDP